ncbi:MAG TPA: 5-(carboxyamino)imidazole ribonucleotide synthase, partial [Gemmataceae bacterium]|nr:5-(carboxyamino)imidazole ribonucleotide synthase [Gemmataceae bacterium]
MRIGILGGGQLGRMLALAGHPLGMWFRVLEPAAECPAAAVAEHDRGEFESYQALFAFCQGLDAVTYEFENVPIESARWLAERVPVFPTPRALEIGQDRIAEKVFFQELGVAVPPFAAVSSRADLDAAIDRIGLPAVLKTTRFGYDGKGQAVIQSRADIETVWATLGGRPLVLEGFVPFERELSILAVRGRTGELAFYPLVENIHRSGILRVSTGPANGVSWELQAKAEGIARKALEALEYVGVLAVELFQAGDDLLVNEMAPRVHNSGHWTIEGAETSQFENHLRAIAGLPLGSTAAVGQSVMINLIGGWPDPAAVLAIPGAHLHLYGKRPRPNR